MDKRTFGLNTQARLRVGAPLLNIRMKWRSLRPIVALQIIVILLIAPEMNLAVTPLNLPSDKGALFLQSDALEEAKRLNAEVIKLYGEGRYDEAIPLAERILAIREKSLGSEHPDVAQSLNNLAELYRAKGDYQKAEPLYLRSRDIFEKALGPEHPDVAASLNNLAVLYEAKGDLTKAVNLEIRAVDISERNITLNLATGSERQKLLYLATFSGETEGTISLHTRSAPDDPKALQLALTTLLRRKGRALDAMTDIIASLRRRLNPQDQILLDQLTDSRAQLATLMLAGPDKLSPAQYRSETQRLEEEIEKLESEVSRRSAEFRAQSQPVTIEAIQAEIPQGAAIVEFALFHPHDSKKSEWGSPRYVAYVLKSQGEPSWVDLGDAKEIDDAVDSLRAVLRKAEDKPLSNIEQEIKPKARALDEKVMQPVRKLLGETRRALISPDGALNLIPFAAMVDEQGRYLVENYTITYLTSGRDLLRLQTRIASKQPLMVIADPNFDYGARPGEAAGPSLGEMAFEPLKRLKASAQEAVILKETFPNATEKKAHQATEEAVKQVTGPEILHIATHGYFLKDEDEKPATGAISEQMRLAMRRRVNEGGRIEDVPPGVKLENPLLKSGLFFAGANVSRKQGEDGILTALEAAGLDLWGTKLVVLSACDTGVGDVRNGEGVYGLRRALVLAASESQMMSLWPVSDTGTQELMVDYYKALKAGQGRSEGLRQVQLKMLKDPKRRHPFYWASFIQSGEWANLDGKRQ